MDKDLWEANTSLPRNGNHNQYVVIMILYEAYYNCISTHMKGFPLERFKQTFLSSLELLLFVVFWFFYNYFDHYNLHFFSKSLCFTLFLL